MEKTREERMAEILAEILHLHRTGGVPLKGVVVNLPFRIEAAIDGILKETEEPCRS